MAEDDRAERRTGGGRRGVPLHELLRGVEGIDGPEGELELQSAFFEELFETAPEAIGLLTHDGRILRLNREFERLFGWRSDDVVGRDIDDLIVPPVRKEAGRDLTRGVAKGERVHSETVRMRRDGSEVPVSILAQPIRFEGRQVGTYVIYRDISRRREREEELRRAKEIAESASLSKTQFLANTSHEIRTPMNAIIGMADLLWETDLSEDQRRYVEIFRSAGNTLLDLINDILDLSKIESGELQLEEAPFRLHRLVSDVIDVFTLQAHGKGLELAARIHPELPSSVRGDATRLRQVLINLLGNAVKFTDEGEVTLSVSSDAPDGPDGAEGGGRVAIRFEVRDTGAGVSPAAIERIFQRFTQADASTTRRHGGTGLGLTISRSLVEMMGGRLEVESGEGKGSTFRFTVPLTLEEEIPKADEPPAGVALDGVRILVVDDNETNRLILVEMLSGWGAEVAAVSGGREALRVLREASAAEPGFDLVLLDGHMPDLDGFDVAEEICRHPELATATVLMITSLDRPGDLARSRELNVASYMVKPVQRAKLAEVLSHLGPGVASAPVAGVTRVESESRDPLPARRTKPGAAAATAAAERPFRVLLAEDVPDNRLLVELYLENEDVELVTVEDGSEAVEAFRSDPPFDLILMDIQMPEVDGLEATRRIRRIESERGLGRTPVVALTAHALGEQKEESLAAGCDAHVTKPIRKDQLIEAVTRWGARGRDRRVTPEGGSGDVVRIPADLAPLVPGYLERRRAEVSELREAAARGDLPALERYGHALKGTGGGYGFDHLTELGKDLEYRAGGGDLEGCARLVEAVADYLDRVEVVYERAVVDE